MLYSYSNFNPRYILRTTLSALWPSHSRPFFLYFYCFSFRFVHMSIFRIRDVWQLGPSYRSNRLRQNRHPMNWWVVGGNLLKTNLNQNSESSWCIHLHILPVCPRGPMSTFSATTTFLSRDISTILVYSPSPMSWECLPRFLCWVTQQRFLGNIHTHVLNFWRTSLHSANKIVPHSLC